MNTLLVDDPTQIKTRIVYTESLGLIEPLKVAEEKAKQVQLAWEKIKDLKGW